MQRIELKSMFYKIDGKYFQAVATVDTERFDCIDTVLELNSRKYYKVARSYTMQKEITWLQRHQVEHLNPI